MLTKNRKKAKRIMKSEAARKKRRNLKTIISDVTLRFYSRMRKNRGK